MLRFFLLSKKLNKEHEKAAQAKTIERYKEELTKSMLAGDRAGQAVALIKLAALGTGMTPTEKWEYLQQALTLCQAAGEKKLESLAWLYLGKAYFEKMDYPLAEEHYKKALDLTRENKDKQTEKMVQKEIENLDYRKKFVDTVNRSE